MVEQGSEHHQATPIESVISILKKENIQQDLGTRVENSLTAEDRQDVTAEHGPDHRLWSTRRVSIENHLDEQGNIDHPLTDILIRGLIRDVPTEGRSGAEILDSVDTFTLGFVSELAPVIGLGDEEIKTLTTPEAIEQKMSQIRPIIHKGMELAAPIVLKKMGVETAGMAPDELVDTFKAQYIVKPDVASEVCGQRVGKIVLETYIDNQNTVLQALVQETQTQLTAEQQKNVQLEEQMRELQEKYAKLEEEFQAKILLLQQSESSLQINNTEKENLQGDVTKLTEQLRVSEERALTEGNARQAAEARVSALEAEMQQKTTIHEELVTGHSNRVSALEQELQETKDVATTTLREKEEAERLAQEASQKAADLQAQLNKELGLIPDRLDPTYLVITGQDPDLIRQVRISVEKGQFQEGDLTLVEKNLPLLTNPTVYGAAETKFLKAGHPDRDKSEKYAVVAKLLENDPTIEPAERQIRAAQLMILLEANNIPINNALSLSGDTQRILSLLNILRIKPQGKTK